MSLKIKFSLFTYTTVEMVYEVQNIIQCSQITSEEEREKRGAEQ